MARPRTGGQYPPIYYCATWHSHGLRLAKALNGTIDVEDAIETLDEIKAKLLQTKEV